MNLFHRIKARMNVLTSDEWIVLSVTAGMMLPTYLFAAVLCPASIYVLIRSAKRRKIITHPAFFITMLMLPVLIIPSIISGNGTGLIYGAAVWLVMVFLLYASSIMNRWLFSNVLDIMLAISVIAAVYGVFCQIFGILEVGRVSSIFENPNHYGYCIEIFVLVSIYQYLSKHKRIYIILLVMNLLCNLMCDCRTAYLAIIGSVVLFAFMRIKKWWLLGVAGGAVGAFVLFVWLSPTLAPRFTIDALTNSLDNRTVYWSNALRWFSRNPIIGYGLCGYRMLSQRTGLRMLAHAHNLPINILLDIGVVGSIALVLLMIRHLSGLRRVVANEKYANTAFLLVAVGVATFIHGMTDVPMLGLTTSMMAVMIIPGLNCMKNECSAARVERGRLRIGSDEPIRVNHRAVSA